MKLITRRALAACVVGGLAPINLIGPARTAQAVTTARAERYRKAVSGESIEAGCARIAVNAELETVRRVVMDFNHIVVHQAIKTQCAAHIRQKPW